MESRTSAPYRCAAAAVIGTERAFGQLRVNAASVTFEPRGKLNKVFAVGAVGRIVHTRRDVVLVRARLRPPSVGIALQLVGDPHFGQGGRASVRMSSRNRTALFHALARGEYVWKAAGSSDWNVEVRRFFDELHALDRELADRELSADAMEKLVQGPLADALTHVGQLAMLRGMAGAAIRPESYARAEIVRGRVGPEQAAPRREFDGDASEPA